MPLVPITGQHFKDYPAEARQIATGHIQLLRKLPLPFAQLLLQQLREYDWRFPAERRDIDLQLSYLGALSDERRSYLLSGFERLQLPANLKSIEYLTSPGTFSEQLSAHLWATHQIGAFRDASAAYLKAFAAAFPAPVLVCPRLGIAVIGSGVNDAQYPLFRKLRGEGTHFTNVNPGNGLQSLLDGIAARAAAYRVPFGHWYVDGQTAEPVSSEFLLTISYGGLEPIRRNILRKMDVAIGGGIGGPEALLTMLHKMPPEEIGLAVTPQNTVLQHFQASLLIAGSGTQIFSTTFVQWTARELWRRAQPLTILARFAPRQRQRPMNELISGKEESLALDPMGSLIDADMGAFYMWLDQQRLPGAKQASFLVWFENHREALLISPILPRNAESNNPVDLRWLFAQVG